MPCRSLPTELLDPIVDHLHDSTDALRTCCLVSKSWVPRTRKHIFAGVKLCTPRELRSWKTAFPDPSNSPSHYTKTLCIGCPQEVTAADAQEGGWLRGFSRVVQLDISLHVDSLLVVWREDRDLSTISLVPFHGFSPALKSLHLDFYPFTVSSVFNLILSFPLLKDLTVVSFCGFITGDFKGQPVPVHPSSSPTLSGSLRLFARKGLDIFASHLSSIPRRHHFRELTLSLYREGDVLPVVTLVQECSSTLEFLEIDCRFTYQSPAWIDLSSAARIKDMVFVCLSNPRWIAMALQTVTLDHRGFKQALIKTRLLPFDPDFCGFDPVNPGPSLGEAAYMGWLELDCTLAKLHESHSVRSKVLYNVPDWTTKEKAVDCMESLLPEVTKRGVVELVDPNLAR